LPFASQGSVGPPAGWLLCDGVPYNITTYDELYAAIAEVYNVDGDAAGTSRTPNLNGRVITGEGSNGEKTVAIGEDGGEWDVTLDSTMMPNHNHGGGVHTHDILEVGARLGGGSTDDNTSESPDATTTLTTEIANGAASPLVPGSVIALEGGGLSHVNAMPFLGMRYIIKASSEE